jgi:hypothetical protein
MDRATRAPARSITLSATPHPPTNTPQQEARTALYTSAQNLWTSAGTFIRGEVTHLLKKSSGSYLAGNEPGEADYHLVTWLARIITDAGVPRLDLGRGPQGRRGAHGRPADRPRRRGLLGVSCSLGTDNDTDATSALGPSARASRLTTLLRLRMCIVMCEMHRLLLWQASDSRRTHTHPNCLTIRPAGIVVKERADDADSVADFAANCGSQRPTGRERSAKRMLCPPSAEGRLPIV